MLAAIPPVDAQQELWYVYNHAFATSMDGWTSVGSKAVSWQNLAGEGGVLGIISSPLNTQLNATVVYDCSGLQFLASNKTYIRVYVRINVASYTSSTTTTVKLFLNGTQIGATQQKTWSGTGSETYILDGWVDLPVNVPNSQIRIECTASGAGIAWRPEIDNFQVYFTSPPQGVVYYRVLDENTGLPTTMGFFGQVTPKAGSPGPIVYFRTNSSGYFTALSFGGGLYTLKVSLHNNFGFAGTDPWHRSWYEPTNGSVVTVAMCTGGTIPTYGYMIGIVDISNTYGVNDWFCAKRELGGVQVICDQKPLSWAKTTYSGLVSGGYYVLTVEKRSGDGVYVHGNVSILDNPTYIEIAASTLINGTVLTPQIWNTTIVANYSSPSTAGDFWKMIADDDDVGAWILLGIPLIFMILAGAHYAFASGMVAASVCAAINASIGYPWYNTAILGWIAAGCLLMLIRDAMKSDGGGAGNR